MKALVVFYSRAGENYFGGQHRFIEVGNTEQAARMIAALTGADLWKLEQAEPYPAEYAACVAQATRDLRAQARPALAALPELNGYEEIYLGYPNYCGTMPMAVYSFLEACDLSGKVIHPFCTHEGSGLVNTVQEIRAAAPGATVTPGLAIQGSKVAQSGPAIESWLRR